MTQHVNLFANLAASFDPQEVRTRSQGGRQLNYITARTVMNRLDDVLGPENWWDEYVPSENSVLCRLTIRLPDGSTVTKCDAGGYAGMADSGDDDKSGFSDAFKRAAVKFGVGRYLYRDGVPAFLRDRDPATVSPAAPAEPRPADGPAPSSNGNRPESGNNSRTERERPASNGATASVPRTGKGLFAWTKDQEQRHEVGLLKYLNNWAKLQDFPGRMIDWDAEQVNQAHAEACRKLQSIQSGRTEVYEEALAN